MNQERWPKLWVRLFKGTCKRYGRENPDLSGSTFVPPDCQDPLVPLAVWNSRMDDIELVARNAQAMRAGNWRLWNERLAADDAARKRQRV